MTRVSTITACYKSGKYLEGFLNNTILQTHKDLEIVLDHNDPPDEELNIVESHNQKYGNVLHIKVDGVDPLGVSWNRCMEYATGEYLCIWSVDDLRTNNSIEIMANTLDENPDVDYVYGNYNIVTEYGKTDGQYVDIEPYIPDLKVGMILGPFFMFRKSLLEKIGVFDEQFFCCNDYDFAMRLTRFGKGMFLSDMLGYYLNEGLGQSTKSDSKQPIERTAIEIRYGVRILDQGLIGKAKTIYDLDNIIVDEEKTPVSNYMKK